jgi:predicted kinase
LGAVYLRIDVIEVAMARALGMPEEEDIGPGGYLVAYDLAASNLRLGHAVLADSVNATAVTRAAWRGVAEAAAAARLEVAVACSDRDEHRRRVEARLGDPEALSPPTWRAVADRLYEPWPEADLTLDTAMLTPEAAAARICEAVAARRG